MIDLLALRREPARLGELGAARRTELFGDTVAIIATEPSSEAMRVAAATIVRGPQVNTRSRWPAPEELHDDDTLLVRIEPDDAGAQAFVQWLRTLAARPGTALSIVPFTHEPAGTFRLWAVAAARLALGPDRRVVARHDLIGIRLAQLAVGFGADTLAGPIQTDRVLPLAGVTRPDEDTVAGLVALVEAAGLRPNLPPTSLPNRPSKATHP